MKKLLIERNLISYLAAIFALISATDSPASKAVTGDLISSKPVINIDLPLPPEDVGVGGIITCDLNTDGIFDFVITRSGLITAFSVLGRILWQEMIDVQISSVSERNGLPGWFAPGVQAADIDKDGILEVLYLTRSGYLRIVRGDSGALVHQVALPSPKETERWEHLVVANFRGRGDRDILLQTTNADGYRMGRFIAAYSLDSLLEVNNPKALWMRDDFLAAAHSGARVSDLDGDGRDEVVGGSIISPDGEKLFSLPVRGHVDAVHIGDIRPDINGLEVVVVEEGGNSRFIPIRNKYIDKINWHLNYWLFSSNRVFLFNSQGIIWRTHYKRREPQNIAIGDFLPSRNGLEIWCRSRFDTHQKPFVFDSYGNMLVTYELSKVAPKDWTAKGVEVIFTIYWNFMETRIAAKERHKSGAIAIINPLSGDFILTIHESADRLYVADVLNDWREELIVVSGNKVRVYTNQELNPRPNLVSLWETPLYHKNKMTWNYYNP